MMRFALAATFRVWILVGGAVVVTAGCAAGGRAGGDGSVSTGDGSQADVAVDAAPPTDGQVDTDAAGCSGGCITPPGDCHEPIGECVGSTCVYSFKDFGEACNDGDGCTTGDTCDGQGNCFGDQLDCNPQHTTGGTCSGGGCVGITCVSGWGDCDSDLEGTGCETLLTTSTDCAGCGVPCTAAAHATASCASGTCVQTCVSPYDDCNDDMSDGCEIPVGVVNQCDIGGLNSSTGCWTAWCGQSTNAYAYNHVAGNWYCAECDNCEESGAQCHWCSHATGTWFPWGSCGCTNYPVVCGPFTP